MWYDSSDHWRNHLFIYMKKLFFPLRGTQYAKPPYFESENNCLIKSIFVDLTFYFLTLYFLNFFLLFIYLFKFFTFHINMEFQEISYSISFMY